MRSAAIALVLVGCAELPEIRYSREGFDLATDFDHAVCEGTLQALGDRVATVAGYAGRAPDSALQIYWLTDEIKRVCPRESNGCFLPGTTILAAHQESLHHEIVHAVLDNRWSQHFLEEGVAEVLGGKAVHFEARDGDPLAAMRIDSRGYRRGEVDYEEAAHFVQFLRAEQGEPFLGRLSHALDIGASPSHLEELLADTFGRGSDGIEASYRQGAPTYYAGMAHEEAWAIGVEQLQQRIDVVLDCDDADTMGPLDEDDGGMYRAGRLRVDDWVYGYLSVTGHESIDVAIFREADRSRGEFVQNWARLDPSDDEEAFYARPGEGVSLVLSPDEDYIVLVSASDSSIVAAGQIHLFTTQAVEPERLPHD